jgi:hypothetical protein
MLRALYASMAFTAITLVFTPSAFGDSPVAEGSFSSMPLIATFAGAVCAIGAAVRYYIGTRARCPYAPSPRP